MALGIGNNLKLLSLRVVAMQYLSSRLSVNQMQKRVLNLAPFKYDRIKLLALNLFGQRKSKKLPQTQKGLIRISISNLIATINIKAALLP